MSQKTLPWPLFVNQVFYRPKCLFLCVRSKVTALKLKVSMMYHDLWLMLCDFFGLNPVILKVNTLH